LHLSLAPMERMAVKDGISFYTTTVYFCLSARIRASANNQENLEGFGFQPPSATRRSNHASAGSATYSVPD